jgi:hypothetical protein
MVATVLQVVVYHLSQQGILFNMKQAQEKIMQLNAQVHIQRLKLGFLRLLGPSRLE